MQSKIPLQTLASFFRQFASVVSSGLSLVSGLSSMRERTRHPYLRRILIDTEKQVQEGEQICPCFLKYPDAFPPLVLALVRAGEMSGKLDVQLRRIADLLERLYGFKRKVQSELLYPKILLFCAVTLPLCGRAIGASISGSGTVTGYLLNRLLYYGVIAGLFYALYKMFKKSFFASPDAQSTLDKMKISIPYLRDFHLKFNFLNFAESFASLYEAGVSVPESYEVSLQSISNSYLRGRLYPLVPRLRQGQGLAENLLRIEELPSLVVDMIAVGEQTGKLDEALKKVVEYYENEVELTLKNAVTFVQPVAMIIVGIIVGYVVISGYANYFNQIDAIIRGK